MTDSECDRAIREIAEALDKLWSDYFDLRCFLVATFAASSLMIFLLVWFGGVNITFVTEAPRHPTNIGELVETLETADPQTPLDKERMR